MIYFKFQTRDFKFQINAKSLDRRFHKKKCADKKNAEEKKIKKRGRKISRAFFRFRKSLEHLNFFARRSNC